MRIRRLWLALVAASAVGTACGEGHAIFVIDVGSFLSGTSNDTLLYVAPSPGGGSANIPPIGVHLLSGASSSIVDTVKVYGTALIHNTSGGAANMAFNVYFGSDSNTVYTTAPVLTSNGVAGPGAADSTMNFSATLTSAVDSLFREPKIFVGMKVTLTNTSGSTALGVLRLDSLHLRVVLQDKIF